MGAHCFGAYLFSVYTFNISYFHDGRKSLPTDYVLKTVGLIQHNHPAPMDAKNNTKRINKEEAESYNKDYCCN